LRSEIHATDSTCAGCTPKSAATNALGQTPPVIRTRSAKSSSVSTMCSATFVMWIAPDETPNSSTSSISDSHVSGCQFARYPVVIAHATLGCVSPAMTWVFSDT
jgi:hypothetical protein